MVRDIESLIEKIYLKFRSPFLDTSNIIVNPKLTDNIKGKYVIINFITENLRKDFEDAIEVVSRIPYEDLPIEPYLLIDNSLVETLGLPDLVVRQVNGVYYFGAIPSKLIKEGNCYDYISSILQRRSSKTFENLLSVK